MITDRINSMAPSATSILGGKIAELKAAGADIVSFTLGEPDFPTPQKIVDSCIKALSEGHTKYTAVGGILPLRKSIAAKLEKDNKLVYSPEQICVSTGAKQTLYNTLMVICNPGDEIIVPTPCWVSYVEMVKLADGVPVLVKTFDDFQLDIQAIKNAITNKTKAILLNTPNNPTGASYPEEDLRQLAKICVENDVYIIADEIYEKLIYGDEKHFSIASISEEVYNRTITINGFSKSFSMTGWRIGYAAGPSEIINAMVSLQSNTTTNSTTFVQWAGITALEECADETEAMRLEFLKRRDYMIDRLQALEGVSCQTPGGAFYVMADISSYFGKKYGDHVINDSSDFCNYILEEAKVAIVPGLAFEMPTAVRFAYTVSRDTIEEGMNRIEEALKKLN